MAELKRQLSTLRLDVDALPANVRALARDKGRKAGLVRAAVARWRAVGVAPETPSAPPTIGRSDGRAG